MSYHTYITEALVCGSKLSMTSDKSYLLYTRRMGMLWATARSVRLEKSKQRYALQEFSLIRVSLVKGKGGWRIGSVDALGNPFLEASTRSQRAGVHAVLKLLRRLVHGEEACHVVYDEVLRALTRLSGSAPGDLSVLQDVFALRLLHMLGYIAPDEAYMGILDAPDPYTQAGQLPERARTAIAQALQVSHL